MNHNITNLQTQMVSHAASEDLLRALSIKEAVHRSGLSRAHLYNEMTAGKLRYLKAGRRRLVLARDLNAYLESLVCLEVVNA